jgi:hypothetical protein
VNIISICCLSLTYHEFQINSIELEIFNSAFFCSYFLYSAGVAALNLFGVKSYLVQGQCMNENVCNWTFTDSWSFVVLGVHQQEGWNLWRMPGLCSLQIQWIHFPD